MAAIPVPTPALANVYLIVFFQFLPLMRDTNVGITVLRIACNTRLVCCGLVPQTVLNLIHHLQVMHQL